MDFHCNKIKKNYKEICRPEVECLKVNSVICTKTVQKVAELTVLGADLGLTATDDISLITYSVVPNPSGIVMRGTLIDGKVVNSGYVPSAVTITVAGVALPALTLNLPFQEETDCPGACAGDDLQETQPVIEGVIPPVFTPGGTLGALGLGTITFKVIIRTQITVSREKLVYSTVNVIGDINPNRCEDNEVTQATTRTFFG